VQTDQSSQALLRIQKLGKSGSNSNPEEEIFKDSKSVPSYCNTGIKNRLVPGINAGSHSGILSLLILPVELEFKVRKCNLLLSLLQFVHWFHFVTKKLRVPVIRLQKESNWIYKSGSRTRLEIFGCLSNTSIINTLPSGHV
jgi:hypothetical protein